jgi:hypothetical protein
MSLWARKKQALYLTGIIIFFLLVIGLPLYFIFFHKQPTCYDNILNQDEVETDCGGACDKVCPSEAQKPIVHWQRFFQVTPGVYTVVASIENPNIKVYSSGVPYRFRLIDADGAVVGDREGEAFLLPNNTFPIFESNLITGERRPVRMDFEFVADPVWQKKAYELANLVVIDQRLSGIATSTSSTSTPRVDATLQSEADYLVKNVSVVAVVYDHDNNAIGASRTVIDQIPPKGKVPLFFTWPEQFKLPVAKIDIIPEVLPRTDI